ncbi:MAG: hypothetical protein QXN59_01150 [Candidatus Micrarchaeaceae archaeon]
MQFWSFDVIFAIVIFTIAMTILAFTWYNINSELAISAGGGATIMQLQAQVLAQSLMSPGYPAHWYSQINISNPSTWQGISLGIGASNGTGISSRKLYTMIAMANLDYGVTKQLLGVGYNYYIMIYNNQINITIGPNPSAGNALTTDVVNKYGYINGQPVKIKIIVWTNTPSAVT